MLEQSSVVANNAMNRERGLEGVNSYARELGFHPLKALAPGQGWLDLCCGSGRALIEASRKGTYDLVGVDLVDYFDVDNFGSGGGATLITASLATWLPGRSFDLITCVHGLHYRYLGAGADPNYTGQPAVDSLYRSIDN